ncbi:MAG: hypothetical protein ACI38Q_02490 [Candidatus Bruticola sp.]
MRKFTATLFLLATLSLGCLAVGAAPAMADESMKTVNVVTEFGPYTYSLYEYPSYNTSFFFYQDSYVEFDVVNGTSWRIESPKDKIHKEAAPPSESLLGTGRTYNSLENFDVYFYAPDGTLLACRKNARLSDNYSFPSDRSHDKVRVRIESRATQNLDAKFIVWEPVNPVVAKPLSTKK